jgi:hypothetical protein
MTHRLLARFARPALALAAALVLPSSAQDLPAAGFELAALPVAPPTLPGGPFGLTVFGVARTLGNGDVVTFDGLTVRRVKADGTPVATLGALGAIAFPGCFAIDPTETFALVGESSNGDVYRAELDGSGMTFLANLPFNYDAAFAASGIAFVSANLSMSFSDNHVVRLDPTTGATSNACHVTGPSGPLAFDALGNLYYGHLAAPYAVIVFPAAALALGVELTELDALTFAAGFAGPAALAVDQATGAVYLADNDFTTGTNRIVRVLTSAALSPEIVVGTTPFQNLGGLELVETSCGGLFAPWQPACGGTLVYSATDFFSFVSRAAATPARASGALTGPGAGPGPGTVAFEVQGAPAFGFAQLFFGPSAGYAEPELAHVLPGAPPLFTGLPLASIQLVGTLLPLDGAGALQVVTYDPGLDGLLTVQALCFDAGGFPVGTSTAAHL